MRPDEILDIAEGYGRLYEVEYATFNNVLTYANRHLALFEDKYIFINSIPGYFIEGEDKFAEKMATVLAVSLSNIKNLYDEKYDKNSFIKNIILDNILPSDIYIR